MASPSTTRPSRDARRGGHGLVQRPGRHHPYPAAAGGAQTLLWGPGVRVAAAPGGAVVSAGMSHGDRRRAQRQYPDDGLHVSGPQTPTIPPPAGTFYGCAPPGIFRIDLMNNMQTVVNANARRGSRATPTPSATSSATSAGARSPRRDRGSLAGLARRPGTAHRTGRPLTAPSCGRTSASAPTG